jgi:hypothetical protein
MKPTKVVVDDEYEFLYRLEWEDGVKSEDKYNITRAMDILRNYDAYELNMVRQPPRRIGEGTVQRQTSGPRKVTGALE